MMCFLLKFLIGVYFFVKWGIFLIKINWLPSPIKEKLNESVVLFIATRFLTPLEILILILYFKNGHSWILSLFISLMAQVQATNKTLFLKNDFVRKISEQEKAHVSFHCHLFHYCKSRSCLAKETTPSVSITSDPRIQWFNLNWGKPVLSVGKSMGGRVGDAANRGFAMVKGSSSVFTASFLSSG